MTGGKDCGRREFMTKRLVYLTSAGLLSASGSLWAADTVPTEGAPNPGKVIQRRLGRTGVTLPVVSMGWMNPDTRGLPVRAYELGARYFDTAGVYDGGRNEETLGNFVKELGVRDKVVISTKVLLSPQVRKAGAAEVKAQFLKSFEGSLRRLQMDHVDILYFHDVATVADANNLAVQEVLADLKKQGSVRFTGVSTHSGQVEVLNAVVQGGFHDVVLVAINFTMSENKALLEAIKKAASKGVGLIAMKTLMGGNWPKDSGVPKRVPTDFLSTAAVKWVLRNEDITTAVTGIRTFAQVELNFAVASNLKYTVKERQFLTDKNLKASLEFCQQCGKCLASCPYHVDIPTLMRAYMYALQYGNNQQAQVTLAAVPKENGLDICRTCASCRAACANTVNITRKINALKTIQSV
jgi:uncharacterized protein